MAKYKKKLNKIQKQVESSDLATYWPDERAQNFCSCLHATHSLSVYSSIQSVNKSDCSVSQAEQMKCGKNLPHRHSQVVRRLKKWCSDNGDDYTIILPLCSYSVSPREKRGKLISQVASRQKSISPWISQYTCQLTACSLSKTVNHSTRRGSVRLAASIQMYPMTLWTHPEMSVYYYAALFAITVPLQPQWEVY